MASGQVLFPVSSSTLLAFRPIAILTIDVLDRLAESFGVPVRKASGEDFPKLADKMAVAVSTEMRDRVPDESRNGICWSCCAQVSATLRVFTPE